MLHQISGDSLELVIRGAIRVPQVVIVLVLALAMSSCSFWQRASGKPEARDKQAQDLQQLQYGAMRLADEYVGRLLIPLNDFQAASKSPADRLAAQTWKISQATSAYTVASGANPTVNALDLVVLATLSRMVVEDSWVAERFGERATPVRDAHREIEERAWEFIATQLSASQQLELRQLIDSWRQKNPHVRSVAYIHFSDFAGSMEQPQSRGTERRPGGIFGIVGLDPMANLDPAVREITQTRLLAERTIYYAQRVPALLDMQVERLTYEFAVTPETLQILGDVQRASIAAQQAGNLADALPALIERELSAAISQFMRELSTQQDKVGALTVQLRQALQAGSTMSDSLNTTIGSLNALIKQFNAPPPPGTPAAPRGKPFDINDYTAAAKQMTATTQELIGLVQAVNAATPAITALGAKTTSDLKDLVSFVAWRVGALILLLAAAVLAAMLAYRWIARTGAFESRR